MGIVGVNVAKNLESTASKTVFLDVPKDGSVRVRFIPPVEGSDGEFWYHTENHFRLNNEDGKGIAVACNKLHGDGACYLCDLTSHLASSDDKNEVGIGIGKNSSKANGSWYAQVVVGARVEDDKDGNAVFEYGKEVKLMRLPKTGAQAVNAIMGMQRDAGEPLFINLKDGRDIIVSRRDTGEQFTKYSAMAAGMPTPLKTVMPDFEKKIFGTADDVWKKIDLRVLSNDEQKAAATRTFTQLDWKAIEKELGA